MTDTSERSDDTDEIPRNFDALRQALIERKRKLPKRLAQVAAFTMANPDEIAFGTAASIAQRAAVQPSTLVRFAQALGYQGFSELQSIFRERLRDRVPTYEERLRAVRDHSDAALKVGILFEGFANAAEHSIRHLRNSLRPETLDDAVSLLAPAETVYLIGQRRSFPVTAYLNYVLGKLGVKNVLIGSATGNDPETLAFATPRDAAIAVSFTPYASATVSFAQRIADGGTPLVVITDSPFSPLLPPATAWFEVVEEDFEGFRPMAATLALSMALAVGIAERRRAS
ncbi:MurR/RpiR family transcriptional regulator [Lichenihabitans sp. Uapishka_5]|uniref:MurR/RpiR family transcriptional regulator n=1 Tax=Lichenihabitans sp. Uapishka_5 TaxID=3037302 RepID=UPI0029E7EAFB|nr:MurR/RpiR family transcriptional regulator [Lichenihabitans sp. Uapishka_5]MDX7951576.1 MurR/RpiR family transcriptional regulator [Lichenihabitans sp. Uapishka_5]